MNKVYNVKMRDFKDCGICSMLSVIKYYGGNVSLEKLRDLTSTDNNGTNAFQIVNCFRKLGFDSMVIKTNNIYLENITYPVIIQLVLPNKLHHFVVLYEINNKKAKLMDPGIGKKIIKKDEFDKLFTGYIISSLPKEKEVILESEIKVSSIFINIFKREKKLIIKLIIISIIYSFLTVILSYYFKASSSNINNFAVLKSIILLFGSFTLFKIFLEYIREYYENYLNLRIDVNIFKEFITHLFYLPSKSVKSRTTGEIITRIKELDGVKEIFSSVFVMLFLDLLLAFCSLTILYILNNKLFLVLLIFIIIYLLFGFLVNKSIYNKVMRNINYETDLNSTLIENIDMYYSIKNLNIVNIILNKIEYTVSNYYNDTFKFHQYFNKIQAIKNSIIEISFFVINSIGFVLIYKENFQLIDLVTFNLLINYAINPIKNIVELLPKYNYIKASLSKIGEFLSIKEENINSLTNIKLSGSIAFNNISYSYNNYNIIIKNLTLEMLEKDKVFLSGQSGSGKSTICNLLYRNIDNYSGDILINNHNLKDYEISDIRANLLYVSQNEYLFCETIKENIILGRDIIKESFDKVCEICKLEDIVSKKPMRYNSLVDPSSKNISGGEKQRIILARGLLKDSNILLLDEALSEVDYDLENSIIKNILKYYQDKTIIYVSHKDHSQLFDYEINMENYNGKMV